jgi:hypothetical protein
MSDRKYQFAYVVMRRNLKDNSSIPCAVFGEKDMQDAQDTADAYNQQFKDIGHEGEFHFEVQITALYD